MNILLSKTCNKQKNFSKQMLIAITQRNGEMGKVITLYSSKERGGGE